VRWFNRGSLLLRFSLLSLVVLSLIAVGLASILQGQMERDALQQKADEVAVIVQGVLGRHLQVTTLDATRGSAQQAWWAGLAHQLMLADPHLVRIKVWDPHGRIVYSNNARQVGRIFPIDDNLRTALAGRRAMDISNLSDPENVGDRLGHSALLETYMPIRVGTQVIGAYEAYCDLSALQAQLDAARHTIRLSVAAGFVLLYASLFAIVHDASRRLVRQMQQIALLGEQAREADTLRRIDRLKDEFIGSVSHELRRPLASIKGYTASLLLPDASWTRDVQREFLQVVEDEADRLTGLIDNLLDLARLGTGSLQLVCEPLHLPVLCEQVVNRIRTQAQLPTHPYTLRFPDRFPYVEGDGIRLSQVLLNLCENAAKYAPAGTPIMIEGRTTENDVMVSVIDRGPGLTAEQARQVFDKFYRVDSGLTRATEGTGLGLAICRGVMEAHGGRIAVDTTPGAGCVFTITLPLTAKARATSAGYESSAAIQLETYNAG
jgi:signal transduction histidine kinase